jgi:hypothetical protein
MQKIKRSNIYLISKVEHEDIKINFFITIDYNFHQSEGNIIWLLKET